MKKIPDKCLDCKHAIIQMEQIPDRKTYKFYMDTVVRCDCFPVHYRVGCSSAEMYCEKNHQEVTV